MKLKYWSYGCKRVKCLQSVSYHRGALPWGAFLLVYLEFGKFLKFFFGQDHGLLMTMTCVFMHVILNVSDLFFSGEGVVCHLDELTGALVLSHRLVISSKDYPGEYNDL